MFSKSMPTLRSTLSWILRTGPTAAIALAICAGIPTAVAADPLVDLVIRRPAPGQIQVDWNDEAARGDGYVLRTRNDLRPGTWAYAGGNPDAWPLPQTTNWIGQASQGVAFYRVERAPRGEVVDVQVQDTIMTFQLGILLPLFGITGVTPTYNVTFYEVTYHTFDHRGQSTLVSGAMCVPVTATPLPVPLVSYQHGTIFERTNAPSNPSATDRIVAAALATEGYAVTLPDFLGLGTQQSPALHPYLHARSEAIPSVDLLRAGLTHLDSLANLSHNGKLFLVGYSQGGHATLALQRELEQRHNDEFTITASAPMAGPHDLSGVMTDLVLSDTPYASPSYLPYILFGLNTVYNLFDNPSDWLQPPYDTTLPPLLDGEHAGSEIDAAMPSVPKQIFRPAVLEDFSTNSSNAFRKVLVANDTYRWTPSSDTTFYHCAGDTIVPKSNSNIAYAEFLTRGMTNVWLVDPAPTADHGEGGIPCFLAAKAWFDTLR